MNIKEKIKAAKKVYVWVETNDDGLGMFVKVDKRDLTRAVEQNWLRLDGNRFRITKDHPLCGRILFIHNGS
jgi:ribosomal protein L9